VVDAITAKSAASADEAAEKFPERRLFFSHDGIVSERRQVESSIAWNSPQNRHGEIGSKVGLIDVRRFCRLWPLLGSGTSATADEIDNPAILDI
jgi:hypothetical protein